jgi:hypothetical protein
MKRTGTTLVAMVVATAVWVAVPEPLWSAVPEPSGHVLANPVPVNYWTDRPGDGAGGGGA